MLQASTTTVSTVHHSPDMLRSGRRQSLENLNIELIAEEKQLAAEKQSLVDELYRHSLCGHYDVKIYLEFESEKM